MRIFLTVFLFFFNYNLFAQDSLCVHFRPVFNGIPLELNKKYFTQNDTITIETLKFYISDIEFYRGKKLVSFVRKKHHLLDLENPESLSIKHYIRQKFNTVKFKIGIDSITNVSGAFGGDLDPTNGMYWTWQSGYINFKLEGKSARCPARNNRFQLHIGGYHTPFNTIQERTLKVSQKNSVINIHIDELLEKTDVNKQYEVMSPSQRAVAISKLIASAFKAAE